MVECAEMRHDVPMLCAVPANAVAPEKCLAQVIPVSEIGEMSVCWIFRWRSGSKVYLVLSGLIPRRSPQEGCCSWGKVLFQNFSFSHQFVHGVSDMISELCLLFFSDP